MRLTRDRYPAAIIFVAGVAFIVLVLDWFAFEKAQRICERAERVAQTGQSESEFHFTAVGDARIVKVSGIEADMCNAFTGGTWFRFLMPRLSRAQDLCGKDVRSQSGYCSRSRGGANTLVFRF